MSPKLSLALFYISLVLAVGLFAGGMYFREKGEALERDTYSGCIGISAATDALQRRASYKRANALRPWEKEPYLLLLSVYAENGVFEKEESSEIISLYNEHRAALSGEADREISKEIAMLLVNGYDGEQSIRLRMAMPFFETAAAGSENPPPVIRCYLSIGKYCSRYVWTAGHEEVTADEMRVLITEISSTLDLIAGSVGVYDRLGYAMAVADLIGSQRTVLAATVEKESVLDLMSRLYSLVPDIQSLQSDASRHMAQSLLDGKETLRTMVLRAYGEEALPDGS